MSNVELTLEAPHAIDDEPLRVRPYRISVEKYHQMIEAGVFTSDDKLELLEGWLIKKWSKTPPHSFSTQTLREMLVHLLPHGWIVDSHTPITTPNSEPEPDVSVIRGSRRDYGERHPLPHEVAIVIEVADSSLNQDRRLKQRIYASAGIATYWLLNLQERRLEVYTQPIGEGVDARYETPTIYTDAQDVPVILDGVTVGTIKVSDLLP